MVFASAAPSLVHLQRTSSLRSVSADGLHSDVPDVRPTVWTLFTVSSRRTHHSRSVRNRRCVHGYCRCVAMVFLSQDNPFSHFSVVGVRLWLPSVAQRRNCFVFSKRALVYGCDDMGECFAPTPGLNESMRRHLPEYWHVTEMANCSAYGVPLGLASLPPVAVRYRRCMHDVGGLFTPSTSAGDLQVLSLSGLASWLALWPRC